ncbi:hypothetical protein QFZ36_000504 [Pseudarthrobacter siccitolerans]|uniref:Phage protein n=1 Tax=Pseudarthrobacter siccitolerans TaxID=861266 RepID=A0ABU0PG52_9MICC|nr:hypothetical protein [Pseudarthrobacter siccitolerans]MDQ0672943.1 hypothetical protein [Pseudarthrobacter siccitolerans]
MADKKEKDLTPVTLLATGTVTPYFKGDVFTVPAYVAKALLDPNRKDADGNSIEVKVEKFDKTNKDHAAALVAQRGKTEDAEVEAVKGEGLKPAEKNA